MTFASSAAVPQRASPPPLAASFSSSVPQRALQLEEAAVLLLVQCPICDVDEVVLQNSNQNSLLALRELEVPH